MQIVTGELDGIGEEVGARLAAPVAQWLHHWRTALGSRLGDGGEDEVGSGQRAHRHIVQHDEIAIAKVDRTDIAILDEIRQQLGEAEPKGADVDPVLPPGEITDHIAAGAGRKHESIVACLAEQHIIAASAIDRIIACTAQQQVYASVAGDGIIKLISNAKSRGAFKHQILDIGPQVNPGIGDPDVSMDRIDPATDRLEGQIVAGIDPVNAIARAAIEQVLLRIGLTRDRIERVVPCSADQNVSMKAGSAVEMSTPTTYGGFGSEFCPNELHCAKLFAKRSSWLEHLLDDKLIDCRAVGIACAFVNVHQGQRLTGVEESIDLGQLAIVKRAWINASQARKPRGGDRSAPALRLVGDPPISENPRRRIEPQGEQFLITPIGQFERRPSPPAK